MVTTSLRPGPFVSLALLGALACGPSTGDDDELGSGSSEVDGVDDTVDLDGTGSESSGSTTESTSESTSDATTDTTESTTDTTDATTTGDPTFEQLCADGCDHFLDCAPGEFAGLYADLAACESACVALYGGCTQEASEYFYCFLGLTCDQVLAAVMQGPDATECGPAYAAANLACGG